MSAAASRDTYLSAKYRRIASRGGQIKALVAVEHAMLIAIFNMFTTGAFYQDPGGDFLHPAQPRQSQEPRRRTAPQDGLLRHPQPRGRRELKESSHQRWCRRTDDTNVRVASCGFARSKKTGGPWCFGRACRCADRGSARAAAIIAQWIFF